MPNKFIYDRGTFTGSDTQTTEGVMFYMTNALCEPAHWSKRTFDALHIPYGYEKSCGDYPLTNEESQYIMSDENSFTFSLPRYGRSREYILFGYTLWWQNKKWLAPTVEFSYDEDDEDGYSDIMGMVDRIATQLSKWIVFNQALFLSRFLISDDMENRVTLTMLIPLEHFIKKQVKSDSYFRSIQKMFDRLSGTWDYEDRKALLHSPEVP